MPIAVVSNQPGLFRAPAGIEDHAEALRRARALASMLRERASAADKDRRVSRESIAAISSAGLFHVMTPREFGGSQLGLATHVEVTAELAAACGSTGWLYAVLAGHNWVVSQFPIEAQAEVFANPDSLAASVVRLGGDKPKRVAGGVRIQNAQGRFCSGIDHAGWIILGADVESSDQPAEPSYLLIPAGDADVIDDWHTSGLRGTGSRSLRIRDAFVPEHRRVAINDIALGRSPGAVHHNASLYRAPFPQLLSISLAGVPLGLGRAGLNNFIQNQRAKVSGWPDEFIGEQSSMFMRVAEAAADIDAGFSLVLNDCREIDGALDGSKSPALDRARYMRDIAHAAYRSRLALNSLFEASGGSVVYDTQELQRIWRDINAAAAHNSFVRERAGGMYGRAALGLPPSKFNRIGH